MPHSDTILGKNLTVSALGYESPETIFSPETVEKSIHGEEPFLTIEGVCDTVVQLWT
jgi:hypothetical protein